MTTGHVTVEELLDTIEKHEEKIKQLKGQNAKLRAQNRRFRTALEDIRISAKQATQFEP